MNLANKLTIIRMILVPVFLVFLAIKGMPYGKSIATIIFILAALTDKLDGYIARSRNQITRFGKFMDPLADKLLVTAALVSLVELQVLPAWAAMIIIAREFAVTGLRSVAAAEGIVIAASGWGKAKTVTQIVAIIAALINLNKDSLSVLSVFTIIPFSFLEWIAKTAMLLAIIITIVSGVDYFVKNKEAIKPDR
ncbi:CDP-diacylglycerol--glycerol-3-phosphate 3-phosphatidyltransferase [Clostridium pascui]|uniref:CDP-diacylglycerol--glycerol-3-phosphate 3-phosphatidyltransferase n=1 Tax=Clostridium pascui TaxID=46609 RepID=UPI00195C8431|nr:CDP-diacylglycerol--glycerol-3-phosphate 3-phosphatidyltransferase [Clostridium pascui]MBM7868998.1 CDP-diacylglycerol--glycerol-3-phosphate 3-phosphatidyltransferase [Clostridium pascui]